MTETLHRWYWNCALPASMVQVVCPFHQTRKYTPTHTHTHTSDTSYFSLYRANGRIGYCPATVIRRTIEKVQSNISTPGFESEKNIYEGLNIHKPPPRRLVCTKMQTDHKGCVIQLNNSIVYRHGYSIMTLKIIIEMLVNKCLFGCSCQEMVKTSSRLYTLACYNYL